MFGWIGWLMKKTEALADGIMDWFGVERRPDNTEERIYYKYRFKPGNFKDSVGYENLPKERQAEIDEICEQVDGAWLFDRRDDGNDLYVYAEGKDGKEYRLLFPSRHW